MFQAEAMGLMAIRNTKTLRVPEVIAVGPADSADREVAGLEPCFLILEYCEPTHQAADFSSRLGHGLANLHRCGGSSQFGFPHDNFIGASPQSNRLNVDWIEFCTQQRIGFQLQLARQNGYGEQLSRLEQRFIDRLPRLLESPAEPPALIHGDLWSGNYLAGADGGPVLIDPAVYYAHRESEFGMTTLVRWF